MSREFSPKKQIARYAPLGLVANPFFGVDMLEAPAENCEIASESNLLLSHIVAASREKSPKPIWVGKDPERPAALGLGAESRVEATMAADASLSVLHAYIPLFGMRNGAVRSALTLLSERLVFNGFLETLAAYTGQVLETPDTELTSFSVMGPEKLAAFGEAFEADRVSAVKAIFGSAVRERDESLGEVADMRQLQFTGDGAATPEADTDEIDETVGDAPGLGHAMIESESRAEEDPYAGVADYIIDYTGEHLSPVIGRALRVFRERGLAGTQAEFNITKAPRKTLAALAKFARVRYNKVVLMYDGFENWLDIEDELRSKIVGLLSELRWSLAQDGILVFMVADGVAPELEESFSGATNVRWDFPGFDEFGDDYDTIVMPMVQRWLANAAAPGADPISMDDANMVALVSAADGSLARFVALGAEAIENAADRVASSIDEEAVGAALAAVDSEAMEQMES